MIVTAIVSTIMVLSIATAFLLQSYRNEWSQRQLAESQRKRADANFRLALKSLDKLYSEFIGQEMSGVPGSDEARRVFVEKAIPFYRQFAEQNQSDVDLWPEVAKAHRIQGEMQSILGKYDKSEQAFRRSISLLEKICGTTATLSRLSLPIGYGARKSRQIACRYRTVGPNQTSICSVI